MATRNLRWLLGPSVMPVAAVNVFNAPSGTSWVVRQVTLLNAGAAAGLANLFRGTLTSQGTRILTSTVAVNTTQVWDLRTIFEEGDALWIASNPHNSVIVSVVAYEFP